ncbi:MAG: HD-GYP domain-containing protein [candidate division NC10 bacterium]|nr:HD-GYP domain-containing protein [candidate division NC10 bacterium]
MKLLAYKAGLAKHDLVNSKDPPMQKDVSCHTTRAVIEYVRRQTGGDLAGLLKDLGPDFSALPRPEAYLTDLNNWVSSSLAKAMFARARSLLRDEEVAYKIGYDAVQSGYFGYVQRVYLMTVPHPRVALRKAQAINAKFNRTIRLELVKLGKADAILRLHWNRELDLSKDFCLFNQGIYTAIPTIWDMPPATLVEESCYFRGDPYCEYHGSWREKPLASRIWDRLTLPRRVFRNALFQMERDQARLRSKFDELHRLNLSLERRIQQLASIYEASRDMVSVIDVPALLQRIMDLLSSLLRFDRALLFLTDGKEACLKITHGFQEAEGSGPKFSQYAKSLEAEGHLLGHIIRMGKPLWAEEMKEASLDVQDVLLNELNLCSFIAVPLISRGKTIGVLVADRGDQSPPLAYEDRELVLTFCNQIAAAIENARLYEDLKSSYLSSVQSLALALEAKDPYTRGHSERVTAYAVQIAEEMKMGQEVKEALQCAGLLHDLGKIGLEERILHKPASLEAAEYEIVKRHPLIGAHILHPISFFEKELFLIRYHHECFDGTGYPDGLSAEEIPLAARILKVADSYDAMTSDRPYRSSLPFEQARAELVAKAGKQFDPLVVKAFLAVLDRSRQVSREGRA